MTCKTTDACCMRTAPTWLRALPDTAPVLRRPQDCTTNSSLTHCPEVMLLRAIRSTMTIRTYAGRPPRERCSAPQFTWRGVLACSA